MDISKILINWYEKNKRELPWRDTKDPYKIWVSEIILQQTRVIQGTDYYFRITESFPDIKSLADASIDDLLILWQGLGYYSRARNMHAAAEYIMKYHKGEFPEKYEDILKLKGIGKYTAAAVASLAFGYPAAAVDGNVIRVISRVFNVRNNANSSSARKEIDRLAEQILDNHNPGQHNQSVIELGALICTPKNPECGICPVRTFCKAYAEGLVEELPLRYRKKVSRERFFQYYIIMSGDNLFIQRRTKRDIWQSLFEFPLFETSGSVSEHDIIDYPAEVWKLNPEKIILKEISPIYKHVLSHQKINARFIHILYNGKVKNTEWIAVSPEDLHLYAFPVLILNYIRQERLKEFDKFTNAD